MGIIVAVTIARLPMVIVRAVSPSQSEQTPQPAAKPASTSATARWGRGVPGIASTATPAAEVASHIRPEIRSGNGPSSWSGPRVGAGGFMALVHPRGRPAAPTGLSVRVRRRSRAASGEPRCASPGSTSSRRATRSAWSSIADRLAAQSAGDRGDVDRLEGRPRRRLAGVRGELVHDRVAAVGHDEEQRADAVARRAPQRLDRVQRRAVAEHRDHGTVGQRHAHADRARQGEAEAAHRRAEEAHRHAGGDAGVQLGAAGRATPRRGWRRPAGARRARRRRGRRAAARRAPAAASGAGLGNGPGGGPPRALGALDQAAADRARLGHDRQLRRAAVRLGRVVGDERQARARVDQRTGLVGVLAEDRRADGEDRVVRRRASRAAARGWGRGGRRRAGGPAGSPRGRRRPR